MAFDPPPTQAMTADGQAAFLLENLLLHLDADAAMEVAHHGRVRMRAESAAEQVVGGADVGDPVAHGLADGVFQRLRAGRNAAHFSAQQPHAQHVQLLAGHVHVAHVDDAFQAEQSADRCGGHAVLAGAGLGNDALLAHALGEQALAERVVDFVRAGVEQVFALEVDFGSAQLLGKPLAK